MYLPFFISLYFLNYSQSIPFGTKDPQHSLVCKSFKMSHDICTFDSHDIDINQLNPNSMIY